MKNKIFKIFALLLICTIVCSCNKNKDIVFDEKSDEYLTPGVEWAVVTDPYAAYRTNAGFENTVSGEGRRGDIVLVIGKCSVNNKGSSSEETTEWYKFEKGWLDSSVISLYDNKMKAVSAATSLK
ncbi:MAG: hypothetical protein WCQ67_02850 [Treponema sp.]